MNKFKSGRGSWRIGSLFFDAPFNRDLESDPMYYLDDVRQEYLALGDLTGVKLANKLFGGYQHLQYMLKSEWFKELFYQWREELVATKIAQALENIEEIANTESGGQRFQANKYLANKEYEDTPNKRGRPSKEEVSGNLKRETQKVQKTLEDYKRMTGNELTVITGGKN